MALSQTQAIVAGVVVLAVAIVGIWLYSRYLVPPGIGELKCTTWYSVRRVDLKRAFDDVLDGWEHPARGQLDMGAIRGKLHGQLDGIEDGTEICHRMPPQGLAVDGTGKMLIDELRRLTTTQPLGTYGALMDGHANVTVTRLWKENTPLTRLGESIRVQIPPPRQEAAATYSCSTTGERITNEQRMAAQYAVIDGFQIPNPQHRALWTDDVRAKARKLLVEFGETADLCAIPRSETTYPSAGVYYALSGGYACITALYRIHGSPPADMFGTMLDAMSAHKDPEVDANWKRGLPASLAPQQVSARFAPAGPTDRWYTCSTTNETIRVTDYNTRLQKTINGFRMPLEKHDHLFTTAVRARATEHANSRQRTEDLCGAPHAPTLDLHFALSAGAAILVALHEGTGSTRLPPDAFTTMARAMDRHTDPAVRGHWVQALGPEGVHMVRDRALGLTSPA